MVVLSLSAVTFSARPRSCRVAVSSLRPVSSLITVPPVRTGDILQHGLAAVAKAGGLDSQHVQHAAQFVQHQGGQRLAVDIFGDDDQFTLAKLDEFLKDGDDILGSGDLLLVRSGCTVR